MQDKPTHPRSGGSDLKSEGSDLKRVRKLLVHAAALKSVLYEDSIAHPVRLQQKQFVEAIESAIASLPLVDQLVINTRYFNIEAPYINDTVVYKNLGIGETFYAKIRDRALQAIAIQLQELFAAEAQTKQKKDDENGSYETGN